MVFAVTAVLDNATWLTPPTFTNRAEPLEDPDCSLLPLVPSLTPNQSIVDAGENASKEPTNVPSVWLYQPEKFVPVMVATSALRVTWLATVGM
jgi:hypothetical protein